MAGQFPGMAGGGISQNNSYMMQQQQQQSAGAAPFTSQPGVFTSQAGGGGVYTSQAGDVGGSFGGQVTSFSGGYPVSQAGLSQAGAGGGGGGYPNPPAYSQSGGGVAYSMASSYNMGVSSYGAQSPIYSQSAQAAPRPQMSVSPAGFPGPAGPYQHHYQQAGFQQQQQQQQAQGGGFGGPMQGFPSPQPQFSQSMQQQQLQAQFAMQQQQQQQQQHHQQQQQGQQAYSALHQQQATMPTQTMMTSASGGSICMSQQQAVVPTATPPQTQVSAMTAQQQQAQQQQAQQQQQQQAQQQAAQQQQQQQQNRDYNVATLCRYGQEHLLELVSRSQELFNLLKMHQPPNGTPQGANISADKQMKIKQHLEYIRVQFRRLRVYHERISECCASFEFTPVESLIPYKDEPDSKLEDKKQSELCRQAMDEFNEMKKLVQQRSRDLKEVIDQLRNIVWDVNTMLAMRHPT